MKHSLWKLLAAAVVLTALLSGLVGCATPTAQVVEKIVTQVVKETVIVEGTPKVVVYNFFGDKVFTGKPELMNGKFQLKIDLSNKQHGEYYMQFIMKNASHTEKIRI